MMHRSPDVEADIYFLPPERGGRPVPAHSGYRPAHKVREDYLTTGVHTYIDSEQVFPCETARAFISFITPELYPHCLWVGREISVQEGSRVVGSARITKILNPILEKTSNKPDGDQE
ncbi:MAG: hypothetical protein ACK4UN_08010 [Limisphaerales bacterium]